MKRFAVITATRRWSKRLDELVTVWLNGLRPETVVIHGNCRTGGDRIANDGWKYRGGKVYPMDPGFDVFGKDGGPARNSGMAALCARLVKRGWVCESARGLPDADSRGTRDCIRELKAAGFEVDVTEV